MKQSKKIFRFNTPIYRANGDSMLPTITDGTLMLAIKTKLSEGDIVIDTRRGIVKRICSISNNKLHLMGDNASQSSEYIVADDYNIKKVVKVF